MRNSKVIINASIAIIVIAAYTVFCAQLSHRLKTKKAECAAVEKSLADSRKTVGLFGHTKSGPVMMAEKDMPIVIDELTKYGKGMGVNFQSIKPREVIKDAQPYKILPVEMRLEATDRQFSDFLGSLDGLKKSLIRVESFDIAPVERDKAVLSGTVVIDIYFVSDDAAG